MSNADPTAPSGITVTVTVPDGVEAPQTMLFLRPETADGFERALEALGGLIAARHVLTDCVSFDVPGGTAYLHFPTELAPPAPAETPQSVFAAKLKERQRDALDFMAELEQSYRGEAA